MVYWTSKLCKYSNDMIIIVSTDSAEYANISRQYGAEVPFLRPEVPFLRPEEISEDESIDSDSYKYIYK